MKVKVALYKRGASPTALELKSQIYGWEFARQKGLPSEDGWRNRAAYLADKVIQPGCEPPARAA